MKLRGYALWLISALPIAEMAVPAGEPPALRDQEQRTADNPLGLSRQVREKFEEIGRNFVLFSMALQAYYIEHKHLPAQFSELTSPVKYLPGGLRDPFVPKFLGIFDSQSLRIAFATDRKSAIMYSVGPDGHWDGGKRIDPDDPLLRGDVIFKYEASTDSQLPLNDKIINKYIGVLPTDSAKEREERHKQFMEALVELKVREGRDNAMIHYTAAGQLMPKALLSEDQRASITQVLRQGWNAKASSLLPLIEVFRPAIQEVRKGVALDYSRNIGCMKGVLTPVPDFLSAQDGAKMTCVEGLSFEQQGKYAAALNNYLTVLTMGRDYGTSGAAMIGELISVAVQNIALNRIHALVTGGYLERPALERLFARLMEIERTRGTISEAFRVERAMTEWTCRDTRTKVWNQVSREFIDQVEADNEKMWGILSRHLATPYWQLDQAAVKREFESALAACNKLMQPLIPNYMEAQTRFLVMATRMLETQIATALAIYRIEKGRYPRGLSELVPAYFKTAPSDLFSGQPISYSFSAAGDRYTLYSVGPDKKDDRGAVLYDPTNGTISGGDIFHRLQ